MNSNESEIEAGNWLARLDRCDSSPADLAAFERWRLADPQHAAAYARLMATWRALDRLRLPQPIGSEIINNDSSNAAGRSRIRDPLHRNLRRPTTESARHPFTIHRHWLVSCVAASLLVALVGLGIVYTPADTQSYSTGVGGFQRIVLEDRSIIELNTDSEVRVALLAKIRKVELVRGEASFEVVHDASRPFIVAAGKTAVRAVGTRFDVRRLDGSVEVIVDEGRVAVGTREILEKPQAPVPSTVLHLNAGEAALGSGGGVTLAPLPRGGIDRQLAWQNQMLVFDGDSLADVVRQFNRYNERQLVIADASLGALHIGGYFRPTNLDAFVSVLHSNFGISVAAEGNRFLLTRASN